jgi:hypothetical protein
MALARPFSTAGDCALRRRLSCEHNGSAATIGSIPPQELADVARLHPIAPREGQGIDDLTKNDGRLLTGLPFPWHDKAQ